ncbi:MAG: class I SAM-dependent methyltransferase [Gemmatimonadota bacterium]
MSFTHDHFSSVANQYADFRPHYPPELFAWLATLPDRRSLAWDVGTGNGQAAVSLAPYFERVIATDPSALQIAAATTHPLVDYRVGTGESSGLASASVDIVTIAQALHWFDLDAFFVEAKRVMSAGAVLAAWTYGIIQCDDPEIDRVLHAFYIERTGPWWPPNRRLVETGYRTIPFPFIGVLAPSFRMRAEWRLSDLLGYVGTWSAVTRIQEATGQDPVADLAALLRPVWQGGALRQTIRWPLSMRVGRL